MQKSLLKMVMSAAAAGVMLSASAQIPEGPGWISSPSMTNPLEAFRPAMASSTMKAASGTMLSLGDAQMEAHRSPVKLTDEAYENALKPEIPLLAPRKGAITSTADLAGQWINHYKFANSNIYWGGTTANFIPVAGNDTMITIMNFWHDNYKVSAHVNLASGKIYIPSQVVTTRTDGTPISVAALNPLTGLPMRALEIEAVIGADGNITIPGYWGIFYDKDDPSDNEYYYRDDFVNVYYQTTFKRGTSMMSHYNATTGVSSSYPVIAKQTSKNVLTVENFLGWGQTVELLLNRDKSYTSDNQIALVEYSMAFTFSGNITYDSIGNVTGFENVFSFPASTDNKIVETSNVTCTYSKSRWIGRLDSVRLQLNDPIEWPAPFTNKFDGEGTAASPWLIKDYNDVAMLSEMVNSDNNYDYYYTVNNTTTGLTDTIAYARPFLGKYFRVENDIDMTGYNYTPAGESGNQWFAGHLDGNGHTIKGFVIKNGNKGYAGLIGRLDQEGSIKNLTLDNISVTTSGIYGGGFVSRSEGVLENLTLTNSTIWVNSGYQGAGGIAGFTYGAKNCRVENSVIFAGDGYAGGIAGQNFYDPMENCHVSGTEIYGMYYNAAQAPMGGIAGTSTGSITDCSVAAYIHVPFSYYPAAMGGIAGQISGIGRVKMERCFFTGRIEGSGGAYGYLNYAGGLAAVLACDVTDCYTSGTIINPRSQFLGGLTALVQYAQNSETGQITQSTFTRCYTSTYLDAGVTPYVPSGNTCMELFGSMNPEQPAVITDCYFNSDITNLGSMRCVGTSAQLTSAIGPEGFASQNVWTISEGYYPRLSAQKSSSESDLSASAMIFGNDSHLSRVTSDITLKPLGATTFAILNNGELTNKGKFCSIEGNTLKINHESLFGYDTIVAYNGANSQYYVALIAPIAFEGNGTADSPWLIKSKADMIALYNMTSVSKFSFPGTYYKMTADIDMEYDETFNGISSTNTANVPFHGTFDGDGHTIHRMAIGKLVWTVKPEDDPAGIGTVNTTESRATYIGLFGVIGTDGVVKNVNIAADCRYQAFASAGAIAGYNYGVIENCRNYADITGQSSWIGGIVGQNQKGSTTTKCFNAGNVTTGWRNAGGISGCAYADISECVNTGTVKAVKLYGTSSIQYAGGIAGWVNGGAVTSCQNFGDVYALMGYAGGITGMLTNSTAGDRTNDLFGNISVGAVTSDGTLQVGGISGGSGTTGSISRNYYDGQLVPQGAMASEPFTGMTGKLTTDLISDNTLIGISTDLWNYESGKYPVLDYFKNEPTVAAARQIYVIFKDDENDLDITSDATLSQAEGLTWSVTTDNGFSISGNTLKVPTAPKAVLNDVLSASFNGMVRNIPLMMIPNAPWDGEGTAESPWLIKTTDDWNSLATLQSKTNNTYEGKYFKITDDLDFANKEFKCLAVDPVVFAGTLDGDNHTVKNFADTTTVAYHGPIGILGPTGTLKNITFNGSVHCQLASGSYNYLGGIAGKSYGTMQNVINMSTVTTTDKSYAAGFASHVYTGAKFIDCINKGTIAPFAGYAAGIALNVEAGVEFIRCGNEGTLKAGNGTGGYLGGLVYTCYPSTFDHCYNSADLTANTNTLGGLVANLQGANTETRHFIFKGCWNSGTLTGRGTLGGLTAAANTTVGGAIVDMDSCYNKGKIICNYNYSISDIGGLQAKYKPGSTITNCWNEGDMTSIGTGAVYGVGGIIGSTGGVATAAYPVQVDNCYNTGNMDFTTAGYWVGGIFGNINAFTSLDGCWNTGSIAAQYGAGGISGAIYGGNGVTSQESYVENCWNMGNITVARRFAGGIIGCAGTASSSTGYCFTITKCWNGGTVKSTSTVAGTATTSTATDGHGIGGIAGQGNSTYNTCANYGEVYGPTFVGGIVGEPMMNAKAKRTCVEMCYNAGNVYSTVEGGVCAGIVPTTNTTFWGDNNYVEYSYYVTDLGNVETSHAGTGITVAALANLNIGGNWTSGHDYIFPIPTSALKNDGWKTMAAALVPGGNDNYSAITTTFHVGLPEGVEWSVATPAVPLQFKGNAARWTGKYSGQVELKATCGSFAKSVFINATETNALGSLETCDIASQHYFTLDGMACDAPECKDGKVYIVITTYTDGRTSTTKLVNK